MASEADYEAAATMEQQAAAMIRTMPENTAAANKALGPDEEEARHAISRFFNAVSKGNSEGAARHLEKMVGFMDQGTPDQIRDFFLTACLASASIENNRKEGEMVRGYATGPSFKEQLQSFGK